MTTLNLNSKLRYYLFLSCTLLSTLSLSAQCPDPDTYETGCGDAFDLCIDFSSTDVNVPVDINITSNDILGIFDPCNIKFSSESDAAPKHGEIELMDPIDGCLVRYTPDLDFIGLDSFDYVLRANNICGGTYCDSGEGKIWTMNNAYYGPTGASVTVTSKGDVFATIHDLVNGQDFFVNGKTLPQSNSNWIFEFYFDGIIDGSPDETADVHTSCSALIFGVNFGIFTPLAGCIATKQEKANCSDSEIMAMSDATYRAINDFSSVEILDTTTVYVIITEGGLLPIDFGAITGRAVGINNLLTWEVLSVVDEDKMILQSSSDGRTYYDIKSYALPQAGSYDYLDTEVSNPRTFYRFKMISVNGDLTYSQSITIENKWAKSSSVQIFPLPTSDELFYEADRKISKVNIVNLGGQLLYTQIFDSKKVSISTKSINLSPGVYFTNITLDNGEIKTQKLSIL